MKILRIAIWLLILTVAILFFVYNSSKAVDLDFHTWSLRLIPLPLIVTVAVVFGALVSTVFGLMDRSNLRRRLRNAMGRVSSLELELERLKGQSGPSGGLC